MERNIIIENICTACRCGERRAEEYLAAELRNLRELRDAGALCYAANVAPRNIWPRNFATCGNCGMPVRCVTAILKRPVLGWDWTSIIRTISAVPCH